MSVLDRDTKYSWCRFASISVAWYFIRGRKDFKGPPVAADADPTLQGVAQDGEKGIAADSDTSVPEPKAQ